MKNAFVSALALIASLSFGCGSVPSESTDTQSQALTFTTATNTNHQVNITSAPFPANLCLIEAVREKWNTGDGFLLGTATVNTQRVWQLDVSGSDQATLTAGCLPASSFSHNGVPAASVAISVISANSPNYSTPPTGYTWTVNGGYVNTSSGIWIAVQPPPQAFIVQSPNGANVATGYALGFQLFDASGNVLPVADSSITSCYGSTNTVGTAYFDCGSNADRFCWFSSVDGINPGTYTGGGMAQVLGFWELYANGVSGHTVDVAGTCLKYAF